MVTNDALLIDQDGGVLTLTINDAPRNRMTFEYMDALEEAVRDAATDASVRSLVFTAAGDEHCRECDRGERSQAQRSVGGWGGGVGGHRLLPWSRSGLE